MTQKSDAPSPKNSESTWYIVQQANGQCAIVPHISSNEPPPSSGQQWGPYGAQSVAIAKRVGLIRAGKCRPM